jgi:hypothetical protein
MSAPGRRSHDGARSHAGRGWGHSGPQPTSRRERSMSIVTILIIVVVVLLVLALLGRGFV